MHVKCLVLSKCPVSGDHIATPAAADSAALVLCSVGTLRSVSNEQIYSIP